ncbi:MAG: SGNH/GDSL hydrolase family protein [Duganella sp.]
MVRRTIRLAAFAALATLSTLGARAAAASGAWTATWTASPHATWGADFALPTGVPAMLDRQTVSETARISVGGRRVRVVLSNRYGTQPVRIGAARVARVARSTGISGLCGTSATRTGSSAGMPAPSDAGTALTFGGQRQATIAPGAPLVSDPVDLPVAALDRLTVRVYLPHATPLSTFHWGAQQTGRIDAGDVTAASIRSRPAALLHGRALLSAIVVETDMQRDVIVALGDSITDGNGSTPDQDRRWPDVLAARMASRHIAVVNAGISGARLLGERMGENAAARFGPDVLQQPGVQTVVVLLGLNDIGWPGSAFAPREPAMTAARMIAAYRQLIAQARTHGVRIVGATLPPFEGALHGTPFDGYYTPAKDGVRREVNRWILTGGEFDAAADVDAALRDPQHPARLLARYDSGDHLHPGDAGYETIAAAVATTLGGLSR